MAEFAVRAAGEGLKIIIAGGPSHPLPKPYLTSHSRRRRPPPRHGRSAHVPARHRRAGQSDAPGRRGLDAFDRADAARRAGRDGRDF
jgi:hypothetical protein